MKRFSAEYDLAIKKHCGDTEKLVNALSYATDSIVDCYAGRCGRTCADHSFVTRENVGQRSTSHPMPGHSTLLKRMWIPYEDLSVIGLTEIHLQPPDKEPTPISQRPYTEDIQSQTPKILPVLLNLGLKSSLQSTA